MIPLYFRKLYFACIKFCVIINVLICGYAAIVQNGDLFLLGVISGSLCSVGLFLRGEKNE